MTRRSMMSSSRGIRKFSFPFFLISKIRLRWLISLVYRPLESRDVAQAAIYMLRQPLNVSVKALDVVPSGRFCRWSICYDNQTD